MKKKIGINLSIFLFISALFFPKINFVPLSAATYLRLDDALIFVFFLIYVVPNYSKYLWSGYLEKWVLAFFVFIGISLFSSFVNSIFFQRTNIFQSLLYSFRHLEYFLYFFVGVHFWKKSLEVTNLFLYLTFWLFSLVILQNFDLIGTFGGFSTERASANTAGPFELAVIISFLLWYFLFLNVKNIFEYLAIFMCAVILIMTQSRITIFAVLFLLFRWFCSRFKVSVLIYLALGCGAFFIFILTTSFAVDQDALFYRFYSLTLFNFEDLTDQLFKLPLVHSSEEYFGLAYDDLLSNLDSVQGDASAFVRFYRWALLLKLSFSHIFSILFGIGPSFASVAVDGYYIRLICETGIVGFFSYLIFLREIYLFSMPSLRLRFYFSILFFTAFFIDIFVSSKVMFLFWFYFGYLYNDIKISRLENNFK